MISTLTPSVVNVDDVEESILYDLEKEFDEMLLDQEDEEGHGGHNNGQAFLIEKLFNLTQLKKSKSDNVLAVEEWKLDDDPSECNFPYLIFLIYRKPFTSNNEYITLYLHHIQTITMQFLCSYTLHCERARRSRPQGHVTFNLCPTTNSAYAN
jgi:hypothetical protein